MILIIGIPTEDPVALAIEAAEKEGIAHVVVNQRDAADFDLDLSLAGGKWTGSLNLSGVTIDVRDVSGIYSRMAEPSTMPKRMGVDDQTMNRSRAVQLLLADWVETAQCRVANRTGPMASNGSKPYQAMQIERSGLRTPTTLITTIPKAAEAFMALHENQVIYKSISGIRSIVRKVGASERTSLDRIRSMPTQFQALVPGTDLRVHVVGEEVYPIEINSSAVDYRYASRDGLDAELTPCELPDEVADNCRDLSKRLELPFCGIDLRRTPEGEHLCFEVNPSPAYSYYENATGQQIARGLVRYLGGLQERHRQVA